MTEREIPTRGVRRYDLPDGWIVLAGKNDADNEFLSLRYREEGDYWFHTADHPGSHVLLLHKDGEEPLGATLRLTASIAAYHSKARNAKKAEVHYTFATNISKPKGSPMGTVRMLEYKSLRVAPSLPD